MDAAVIAGISAGAAGLAILGFAAIFGMKKNDDVTPRQALSGYMREGSWGNDSFGAKGVKKHNKTKKSDSKKKSKKSKKSKKN